MKFWLRKLNKMEAVVTPFVGVWIEIRDGYSRDMEDYVTPFVGVWIEILSSLQSASRQIVTPFVGVWIEILSSSPNPAVSIGHSLRGSVD